MDGEATPDERQEFRWLLGLPENEAVARQLLVRAFREDKDSADISEETASGIVLAILSADNADQGVSSRSKRKGRRSVGGWRRAAFAATMVLLVTGALSIYRFGFRSRHRLPPIAVKYQQPDALPGRIGAVLTLADGRKVSLDSAGNESLPQQGNAQVILAGKTLQYTREPTEKIKPAISYNTIVTARGRQYQLVLADGTRVWLNAGSSMRFPTAFEDTVRKVELSGEVYLEVAKDPNRPFYIETGGVSIAVLGTSLNINAYPDEATVKTTLLEGAVVLTKGKAKLRLAPGEQAQTTTGDGLSPARDVDVDQVVAWKNGYFSFDDADIRTVMRQLARWYAIQVQYEGIPTQALFEGKIERNLKLSQVLQGLSMSKVHFSFKDSTLTVLP